MATQRLTHAEPPRVIPPTIHCRCGRACIPAPEGATPRMRYTCPECCQRQLRRRKIGEQGTVYYSGGPVLDWGLREIAV